MRRPIILTRALAELLAGETHERVIDSAAAALADTAHAANAKHEERRRRLQRRRATRGP
jgi:16S rRNA C967 or C1407 C5-methylase (RsmB/RsmF family)